MRYAQPPFLHADQRADCRGAPAKQPQTYCSSVLSFLADIVEYASGLDKRVEDPVIDQLLAWGDKFWERLLTMLETIAASSRLHPSLGNSLAELTLAYDNLYCERSVICRYIFYEG